MRLRRPSPAMGVALVALFVALSGVGYAAVTLPRHSVGFRQLKPNSVSWSKIRRGAVTTSKVRDHSLKSQDFAPGTLLRGPRGLRGLRGAKGATGARGPSDAFLGPITGPTFGGKVPAGTYVFAIALTATSPSTPPAAEETCTLTDSFGHTLATSKASLPTADSSASLSLNAAWSYSAQTTIRVSCSGGATVTGSAIATRVEALHPFS